MSSYPEPKKIEVFDSPKPPSTANMFWKEIKNDKFAMVGFVTLTAIILFVVIASAVITTEVAGAVNLMDRRIAPSWAAEGTREGFPLGTDDAGRNMFYMTIVGGRNSLLIGFAVSLTATIIGLTIGIISGFFGGKTDNVIMRMVDTWSMLPGLMVIIALVSLATTRTIPMIIGLLIMFAWMGNARLFRSVTLQQRNLDYVSASKTLGTRNIVIIFREILPNLVSIISAQVVISMSVSIGIETGLSILGFGLPIGTPSLGNIINNALSPANLQYRWWTWLPAIIMVFVISLSINFVGQAVSRAADPKQRTI